MLKVAVTGASGFIGKRFIEYNRNRFRLKMITLRNRKMSDIDLNGADVVVHFAGKAHDMTGGNDQDYFKVNTELTKDLAVQAIKQGVSQFVYISSVKVYGEEDGVILDENTECHPIDAYGKSKLLAEQWLWTVQSPTFRIAVIRPSLVYGPGVKGNMINLLKLADKAIPLPFGRINNMRSMVYLDNLVELINKVMVEKAHGIFVGADQEPVSTSRLVQLIRKFLGRKPNLLYLPGPVRKILKGYKPSLYKRLFGSFVIGNKNNLEKLNFVPPFTTEYGLQKMVEWYKIEKELDKQIQKTTPLLDREETSDF